MVILFGDSGAIALRLPALSDEINEGEMTTYELPITDSPAIRSDDTADEIADALRMRLHDVLDLELDDPRRVRLSHAGTSVAFTVRGACTESVTLLLDRDPPSVADPGEPAEVGIELSPKQARDYMGGGISLGALMLASDVPYRGPVRKYLMVDAVIRKLLGAH